MGSGHAGRGAAQHGAAQQATVFRGSAVGFGPGRACVQWHESGAAVRSWCRGSVPLLLTPGGPHLPAPASSSCCCCNYLRRTRCAVRVSPAATPLHLPHLIGPMQHYLWILKTTHSGEFSLFGPLVHEPKTWPHSDEYGRSGEVVLACTFTPTPTTPTHPTLPPTHAFTLHPLAHCAASCWSVA